MNLRRTLLVALMLVGAASTARAQTTSQGGLSLTLPSGAPTAFSQRDCQDKKSTTASWELSSSVTTKVNLTFFLSDATTCPESAPSDQFFGLGTHSVEATSSQRSGTLTIPADKLGGKEGECPANTERTWLVCGVGSSSYTDPFTGQTTTLKYGPVQVSISYDSKPPKTPQIVEATGGDQAAYLRWDGEDVASWTIYYRKVGAEPAGAAEPCPAPGTTTAALDGADGGTPEAADAGATPPQLDLTGYTKVDVEDGAIRSKVVPKLVNEQQYEFVIVGTDAAGNVSLQSNVGSATPRLVQDFYRRYRCAGGDETGGFGCSAAGAAMVPVGFAALAALGLLRRRRSGRQG